jgi:hypothetical protein
MKRLINQIGDSYWKYRHDPLEKHLKQYEDNVNTFAKLLIDMRRNANGIA